MPPVAPDAPVAVMVVPTHTTCALLNVISVGVVGSLFTEMVAKAGIDQPQHCSCTLNRTV